MLYFSVANGHTVHFPIWCYHISDTLVLDKRGEEMAWGKNKQYFQCISYTIAHGEKKEKEPSHVVLANTEHRVTF